LWSCDVLYRLGSYQAFVLTAQLIGTCIVLVLLTGGRAP